MSFCNQCLIVISSSAFMTSIKRVGAKLSPCLTPVLQSMSHCFFQILNLITMCLYNFSITFITIVGILNLERMHNMRVWLMVSNTFTRSTNTHHVSKLCCLWVWRMVLRRNETCCHPVLGVKPNKYLVPHTVIKTWRRTVIISIMILEPLLRRFMTCQFIGM